MDKEYIKIQIAMRQAEFPTDLKKRENPLPAWKWLLTAL